MGLTVVLQQALARAQIIDELSGDLAHGGYESDIKMSQSYGKRGMYDAPQTHEMYCGVTLARFGLKSPAKVSSE